MDADDEIQMDVLIGHKAVLEVAGKTRVAGGVIALRDRSPQKCLGVGRPDHVQRRPTAVAGGEAFYVGTEGARKVVADCGAHGERDESCRQKWSFHGATDGRSPSATRSLRPLLFLCGRIRVQCHGADSAAFCPDAALPLPVAPRRSTVGDVPSLLLLDGNLRRVSLGGGPAGKDFERVLGRCPGLGRVHVDPQPRVGRAAPRLRSSGPGRRRSDGGAVCGRCGGISHRAGPTVRGTPRYGLRAHRSGR